MLESDEILWLLSLEQHIHIYMCVHNFIFSFRACKTHPWNPGYKILTKNKSLSVLFNL